MKIAVITRHGISNYGSLLQTFATQRVIEKLGYQCEIIDYIRKDEEPQNWEKTSLAGKKKWNANCIKRFMYLFLRNPESIIAGKKFQKMREKYLHLSQRYSDAEELKSNVPKADCYLTGSDQVWGKVANGEYDDTYFLSFVADDKKKIAYAASMGNYNPSEEYLSFFKNYLPRYDALAVREKRVSDFLRQYGIDSYTVLDPTLLIDVNEWDKIADCNIKSKYLLIYQLHNNPTLNIAAKKIASRMKLKIVRVSPSLHQISRTGRLVYLPDVNRFLSLIKNATYMVTDSFHGTVFAITYHTPFAEVLPENGTSSRNINLLTMTGLEKQIVTTISSADSVPTEIDYSSVDENLKAERNQSFKILKNMLGETINCNE